MTTSGLAFGIAPPPQVCTHAAPAPPEDVTQRLGDDGTGHLALALASIDEDDWDLFDARALQVALVGRLNQKAVANHVDGIEVEGCESLAAVAFIARRAVAYRKAQHGARHRVADAANDAPAELPVRRGATRHVARADDQIVAPARVD